MRTRHWVTLALVFVGLGMVLVLRGSDTDRHPALTEALIEARRGNVEGALALIEQEDVRIDPARTALRLRLLAANGRARRSLIELARAPKIEDAQSVTAVLATLYETLERLPSNVDRAEAGQYVFDFGVSQLPDGLAPRDQAVLEALRAYETGERVDTDGLETWAQSSSDLRHFIEVAKVRGPGPRAGH